MRLGGELGAGEVRGSAGAGEDVADDDVRAGGVQGREADAGVVGADPDPGPAWQGEVLANEVGEGLVDLDDALT
jgi:hypothetical protein